MPDNLNEKMEQEARESLVASDLSAKMKQWRRTPSNTPKFGGFWRILLLLLVAGGGIWWFRSASLSKPQPPPPVAPKQLPAKEETALPEPPAPRPVPKKPMAGNQRYLALAQTSYSAPDFSSEIRGEKSGDHEARKALYENRPADALIALQHVPAAYANDAKYLRAHALFQLKKYEQSAVLFSELHTSVRYGEAAQWYEILALLPAFDTKKSLIIKKLNGMANDANHTFYKEARRLYEAL
jgi:hypothetical protein